MNQPQGVGKFQPQARPAGGFVPPNSGTPAATPAPAAPAPAAAFGASPWRGVQSAKPRSPMLGTGDYVVRVLSNELGYNPNSREQSFKGSVEVMWAAEGSQTMVGERAAVINKLHGPSAELGYQRSKAYIVAAAGFESDAEYDAFDPNGDFAQAVTGTANAYSQEGYGIVGRLVRVRVSRGNDVIDKVTKQPTGDYYREYSWSPIPEENQDQTKKPGA